jgi:hypothetical protein
VPHVLRPILALELARETRVEIARAGNKNTHWRRIAAERGRIGSPKSRRRRWSSLYRGRESRRAYVGRSRTRAQQRRSGTLHVWASLPLQVSGAVPSKTNDSLSRTNGRSCGVMSP